MSCFTLRNSADERGQALLEYAVIMPLFLFLMMGVIQLGLIMSARITLKYAAFCAARAALSAEHLVNEEAVLTYPVSVGYGDDVELGEATEAALLVMGAIPTAGSGALGGSIDLPGWGELRNTAALRQQLNVQLYDLDNPDPDNSGELSALLNSVDPAERPLYEPITAKLEYDMQLLFPNFSLAMIGVFEKDLFGDDNTVRLTDSCTLIKTKVPEL